MRTDAEFLEDNNIRLLRYAEEVVQRNEELRKVAHAAGHFLAAHDLAQEAEDEYDSNTMRREGFDERYERRLAAKETRGNALYALRQALAALDEVKI